MKKKTYKKLLTTWNSKHMVCFSSPCLHYVLISRINILVKSFKERRRRNCIKSKKIIFNHHWGENNNNWKNLCHVFAWGEIWICRNWGSEKKDGIVGNSYTDMDMAVVTLLDVNGSYYFDLLLEEQKQLRICFGDVSSNTLGAKTK